VTAPFRTLNRIRGSEYHLAFHLDHVLGSQISGQGKRFGFGPIRAYRDLEHTAPVSEVDKVQSPQIPTPMNPSAQDRVTPYILTGDATHQTGPIRRSLQFDLRVGLHGSHFF
jgi:hypothetical protein